jgi:hypothetical protein
MSRICIAMLSIVTLAACGDSENPLAPSSAASGAPRVSATTTVTNERVPFFAAGPVPCANGGAGDFVVLEGTSHNVTRTTESASGNLSVTFHSNTQGVKGTGLITGDTYQGNSSTTESITMGPGETRTFTGSFLVVGPGPDNNFTVHQTTHLTVNANGEVTSDVDNISFECR